jgi:hypothetical protein
MVRDELEPTETPYSVLVWADSIAGGRFRPMIQLIAGDEIDTLEAGPPCATEKEAIAAANRVVDEARRRMGHA